jgi:predicted component of type VI protein secretion system
VSFDVRGRALERVEPPLDTVLVDTWQTGTDKPIAIEMVWRASVKAPRKMTDALVTIEEAQVFA